MPGILGIISKREKYKNELDLRAMISSMSYETFYTSGMYINDKLDVYAGWVCQEESFSESMPFYNEKRDTFLIFSGEHFPDKDFALTLKRYGYNFDPSDASSLIHLYEEEGEDFLRQINGRFSGLLIDIPRDIVLLFNDRYGLSRIYYHENADGFYFSSEAKAILKVLPGLRQFDFTSLAETLSCGSVLQNRTLFSGISLLPGGSKWVFRKNGKIGKYRYFDPEIWEKRPLLKADEYHKRLKDTFTRILPKYFAGNRQIGMSLTGGLDGRMIMAWANRHLGELPCYTFSGVYRDCVDAKIAQRVAKICNQSHTKILIGDEFFPKFPKLAQKSVFISDGCMDVTGSVELFANIIAANIAPIRLTGNYGTEILRGYVTFKPRNIDNKLFDPSFSELVQKAVETYKNERLCHNVSFIAFKQVPWHHYSRLSLEQSQLTVRTPYLDNDLVALIYQAPPELIKNFSPSLRLIAEGNPALAKIPTDRGFLYRPIPIFNNLKRKWINFIIKAEYTYNYGMPQWLAKLDNRFKFMHFEELFLGRNKFDHFRIWYRDELADYVKAILLDEKSLNRPYLNRETVEEMVIGHTKGFRNYTTVISQLLTIELTHRHLIENNL